MISVCIATYNGEAFVYEQLNSILKQLSDNDEVLISDDNSSDNTLSIIASIRDPRLVIFKNHFRSPSKNFGFLIAKAKGDIIFLADQDDIWLPNKVEKHLACYLNAIIKPRLIVSNYQEIDQHGNLIVTNTQKEFTYSFYKSLWKNHFTGCTMSFDASLKNIILPFPSSIPMHDWWIGLLSIYMGDVVYIKEPLVYYRRHSNSVTTGLKTSSTQKLYWRLSLGYLILLRIINLGKRDK